RTVSEAFQLCRGFQREFKRNLAVARESVWESSLEIEQVNLLFGSAKLQRWNWMLQKYSMSFAEQAYWFETRPVKALPSPAQESLLVRPAVSSTHGGTRSLRRFRGAHTGSTTPM